MPPYSPTRRNPPSEDDRLNAEELYELLLVIDENNTRFTQDSPILPEVWVQYGLEPGQLADLLATPLAGTRFPKQNLVTLRRELAEKFSTDSSFAWLDECLLVSATWRDLLNVLLPRTAWFQELVKARQKWAGTPPPHPGAKGRLPSESERAWWWLMRVIATIDLIARGKYREARAWFNTPLSAVLPDPRLRAELQEIVTDTWLFDDASAARSIYSIALNRPATRALERSRMTVKADAAERVFGIQCTNITWGVVDAGIDARHRGFWQRRADGTKAKKTEQFGEHTRILATYDFSLFSEIFKAVLTGQENLFPKRVRHLAKNKALINSLKSSLLAGSDIPWNEFIVFLSIPHDNTYILPDDPHGTHVAGIIGADVDAGELEDSDLEAPLRGICPDIRLIDLRVFDNEGHGDEFSILAALQFVRYLNRSSDRQRIHGVNISLSLQHKASHYACGSTPVCRECDRLVGSGVVVVAAAGNLGFSENTANWTQNAYRPISITDPGNAECVITVGATHRESPHTYGVSYFSSRGPTGDGRPKPDIVAPGEKILSLKPEDGVATRDGTSMAAPHVSGVAAMLLARYTEMSGQPARIKSLLCATALDLRRERSFQGAGLVDALKALQSI